jgi:hypothetical protein
VGVQRTKLPAAEPAGRPATTTWPETTPGKISRRGAAGSGNSTVGRIEFRRVSVSTRARKDASFAAAAPSNRGAAEESARTDDCAFLLAKVTRIATIAMATRAILALSFKATARRTNSRSLTTEVGAIGLRLFHAFLIESHDSSTPAAVQPRAHRADSGQPGSADGLPRGEVLRNQRHEA